jgi:hypothetical protein
MKHVIPMILMGFCLTGCLSTITTVTAPVVKTLAGQVIAKIALRKAVALAVDKKPTLRDNFRSAADALDALNDWSVEGLREAVIASIDWGSLDPADRADLRDVLDLVFHFYADVSIKAPNTEGEEYLKIVRALAQSMRDGTLLNSTPASRPGGVYLLDEGKVIIR